MGSMFKIGVGVLSIKWVRLDFKKLKDHNFWLFDQAFQRGMVESDKSGKGITNQNYN
jgi:hypothetical protein